jgi:hypothetical protein
MGGPHAGEPTTQRGEIERLARECQKAECRAGLDAVVVETRFNVVRTNVTETVTTARRLRDYLPPVDRRHPPTRAEALLGEIAATSQVGPEAGTVRRLVLGGSGEGGLGGDRDKASDEAVSALWGGFRRKSIVAEARRGPERHLLAPEGNRSTIRKRLGERSRGA